MKGLGRLILVLIIVVPIIVCVATLNKVWNEEDVDTNINESGDQANGTVSGDPIIILDNLSGDIQNTVSGEMAGEEYVTTLGSPISKIYTDAEVSVSVANVYIESRETSEIVGTLEKHAVVTAQKYPEGWSRVTNDTVAGWMKTENITFPEGATILDQEGVKVGKIKAEPYLNVRAAANSTAEIISQIPNGTEITIKDEVKGWYKVTYASATGWVSADFVEVK